MPTTSGPSQASTVPSAAINDRHAANDSGWLNLPKLVESSSAIAGQSASVADRIARDVDVEEAGTKLDGATYRAPTAPQLPAHPIPLNRHGRSAHHGDR